MNRLCAFVFALAATLCLEGASPGAAGDLPVKLADPGQWAIQTGDYAATRFSRLDQITTANVKDLTPVWSFSTGALRGHEGGPLVVDGIMYVHAPFPNMIYALDLDHDGRVLWSYTPRQDPQTIAIMCCDTVYRGLAYADGRVFLHQADTTVVALDAKTGKVLWSVKNGDIARGETNSATVLPIRDKIIVGIAGGEYGARCHVTAYEAATGKRLWRAYSVGPDEDLLVDPDKTTELGRPIGRDSSLKTWSGDQWKLGGGCTWGWFSYDPELDLFYYGAGNPSTWNPMQRPGDNKWAMTIFARSPETGMAKWVYQTTPHDEWDYDGVNEMVLSEQTIDGRSRKVLSHFDRNGFGYTLDRVTGELLVAEKFEPTVNWATRVDMDKASPTYGRPLVDKRYSTETKGEDETTQGICPGAPGAKNQAPSAYSPLTGLNYVPVNRLCMDYEPFRVTYTPGQPYVGATLTLYGPKEADGRTGRFIAWDPKTGKIVWAKEEPFSVWSGALATAGGLVFYGTLEGYLKAVDAKTGAELWRFKTPSGIVGNPMTYTHKGRQYVAVLSGVGGWAGIGIAAGLTDPQDGSGAVGAYQSLSSYTAMGGVLTVFGLR